MAKIVSVFFFLLAHPTIFAQLISGRITTEKNGNGLAFASIGIIGTDFGTLTNEDGFFKLNVAGQSLSSTLRVSMIGYKPQRFLINDLVGHENMIKLKENITELKEVVIKTKKVKQKTLGGKSSSFFTVTGWGQFGNGGERGTLITIKKNILVEKVSFHIAYLGYDSVLLRLHIRDVVSGEPENELLNENILKVARSTGWHEINLTKYNLAYEKNIVVTLEWIKAWGKYKDVRNNGLKFSINWFKGPIFAKEAGESKWIIYKKWQPGIYLTVLE